MAAEERNRKHETQGNILTHKWTSGLYNAFAPPPTFKNKWCHYTVNKVKLITN